MNKLLNYIEFLRESKWNDKSNYYLPTYEDCVEMCNRVDSAFYESKFTLDGYPVSVFNYRLAQYKDFVKPLDDRPEVKAYEMRGLTFVFNKDGSLFKRFLLLEKFFNLNQVPESMYSVVKNYKIKFVNNKEDGSIASYIQLPNGRIIGKSKMSFESDQANGINRLYRNREDIKKFVDWCFENDIIPIFEYVSPANRIVLRYIDEDLILLRLRDNNTGKHLNIKDYLDKIGSIKIAPFEDEYGDLDSLIEVNAKQIDKEGVIVQAEDESGNDFFFKLKTPWYMELHGLLNDDLYREHIIIQYILDDKIDDVLGQIPAEEYEARERIERIIKIVKEQIDIKVKDIENSYKNFKDLNFNRKEYALKFYKKDPNFRYVMSLANGEDIYDLAKKYISDKTKRLQLAREWLKSIDNSLFFKEEYEE